MRLENMLKRPMTTNVTLLCDLVLAPNAGETARPATGDMISVATAWGISRDFPVGVIDAFGHLCGNLPGRSERMSETRAAGMTAPAAAHSGRRGSGADRSSQFDDRPPHLRTAFAVSFRDGSPSRTRTYDLAINSRVLYQLSYRGMRSRVYKAGDGLPSPPRRLRRA